jgi:autophagy-related protein 18
LNSEGTLLASASIKGTVIRIFGTEEGEPLQELRRGSGKAFITSIVFHPSLNLIACTSNRTSIHLFEIKKSMDNSVGEGKTSPTGDGAIMEGTENKKSM